MHKTMPLADFIAQLQKLEAQHPGIQCAVDDQENGIDLPDATVKKVYRSPVNQSLNRITPAEYQLALKGIERYEATTAEQEWKNAEDTFQRGYAKLGGFPKYKQDRENSYNYRKKVVSNYQNSQDVVIINVCNLNT